MTHLKSPVLRTSITHHDALIRPHYLIHYIHLLIADLNPNVLQPTNNLDLEAVVALADAVESFEGGVVVVSHSRAGWLW